MDLKKEWSHLKGHTKMMIVGGGGLALFFLYTAIKNRNAAVQVQQASPQSSGQAPDYSSALDQMTSQMQDMQDSYQQSLQQYQQADQQQQQADQQQIQQFQQSFQDMVNKNKQTTQSQINNLISKMGDIQTALKNKKPTTTTAPPPAAYAHPIKGPTHPVVTKKPVAVAHPIKGPTHPVVTKKPVAVAHPIKGPTHPVVTKKPPAPKKSTPHYHTYIVKKGDTLSQIAEKTIGNYYHGGKQTILKLNPQIKNPDKIYTGEKIKY